MSSSLDICPTPFHPRDELLPGPFSSVPGYQFLPIPASDDPTYEEKNRDIRKYLWRHLSTHRLKRRYKILWLLARPGTISTLGHQAITTRNIVVTERPDLHLLWGDGKIYVKSVPEYLMNHSFFEKYVANTSVYDSLDTYGQGLKDEIDHGTFYGEALGFLHTWYYLIQHRNDFELALQLGLLPKSVGFDQWVAFIRPFKDIPYTAMAPRFHYGDLRLGRLNLLTRLCGYSWSYLDTERYYYDTLGRTFGLCALAFAGIAVFITCLQTSFMVDTLHDGYSTAIRWLSRIATLLVAICFATFFVYFVAWFVGEVNRLVSLCRELRARRTGVGQEDPVQTQF